jgi:hypothetical protein
MRRALRIVAQMLLYVPLMALIGYFSSFPRFKPIGDGKALVRVSLLHAGERKQPCRERSAQELAKLAPNMRAAQDCPRERADLLMEIEVDGQLALHKVLPPSGWRRDGNAGLYHRFTVAAGRHRVVARLRDRAGEGFNYVREETLELQPGTALTIDFAAEKGGFLFRS